MKIYEKDTIRYKILNGKKVPLCDYEGTCTNKAHREVYPSLLKRFKKKNPGWSYLCRKHFEQEEKRFRRKLPCCTLDDEPELRPEYIEKLKRISKEKGISFKNVEELRKRIEGK